MSRTQHGGGRFRTPDLSLRSPTLYHWATALPALELNRLTTWKCDVQASPIINIIEPRHDKTNNVAVRPAKTQISLGIRSVWSESSLCAQWVAKDPSFLHADSEDSDQTGRMPRLICLRWAHTHLVGFVMSRLLLIYSRINRQDSIPIHYSRM